MHFANTRSLTQHPRSLRSLGIAAALALTGLWSSAQAAPMYYTFEGTIDSRYHGGTDFTYFADAGLTVGSAVSYTFLVDFDKQASSTRYNGTTITYSDGSNFDYFWSDYIAGSALQENSLGPHSGPSYVAEHNYGFQYGSYGTLLSGTNNNSLTIMASQLASSWGVGDTLRFRAFLYTSNAYDYEYLNGDLILANISDHFGNAAAVPEPGTLALMGLGLVGMCLRRRPADGAPLAA